MKISKAGFLTGVILTGMVSAPASAALITFDDLIAGQTSYGYDGDGDSIDDVVFSTSDPFGFNSVGPGTNMTHINEPGIEGTTGLTPDLRVDFLNGAVDSLQFAFAMSLGTGLVDGVTFDIFDGSDSLLASSTLLTDFTPTGLGLSSFPEALLTVNFGGIASYATFDFSNNLASRYIIDNFQGTFGSTEEISTSGPAPETAVTVPEPGTLALMGLGLLGMTRLRRKAK